MRDLCLLLLLLLLAAGCTGAKPQSTADSDVAEAASQTPLPQRNLAWLGGQASPLAETLTVEDPSNSDNELYPGGLRVDSVEQDSALMQMGIRAGDILVRVGEEWLPNKEDPTMDFVRLLEGEVSAEQQQLTLSFLRHGKLNTADAAINRLPLEKGLPLQIERYDEIAGRAVDFLLSQQLENGSFPAADEGDPGAKLMVSSLCGLALHAADSTNEIATAQAKLVEFVKAQIDFETAKDPLAAAYALMFLVEAAPPPANIEQLGKCLSTISESQAESGAWLEGQPTDEEANNFCDVQGTFATNQILMALGAAERAGMIGDNGPIEKAVAFLKAQSQKRISVELDRRVKTGLSAGTAAALISLNVDRSDKLITKLSKEAFALAEHIPQARSLAIPHTLTAAILSRQSGAGAWIEHHRHAKLLLAQSQLSDGSFEEVPAENRQPLSLEAACDGPVWRTAHYCLIAQLQKSALSALAGEKSHPMLAARDGDGKQAEGAAGRSAKGNMAGGLQLDLDGLDPSTMSQEELQEKLMEKLKEQGIDIDSSSIQVMSVGDSPDGQ